jgi:hypothetical protein
MYKRSFVNDANWILLKTKISKNLIPGDFAYLVSRDNLNIIWVDRLNTKRFDETRIRYYI